MTYELFGTTYTILQPEWLQLLWLLPLLWLPLWWQRRRGMLFSALVLRTLAAVLVAAALAGLSTQTTLPEHKLSLVAAIDVSDSIAAEGRTWMKEYLDRLIPALGPDDEFSALSFATDTNLLIPPGPASTVQLPPQSVAPAPAGQGGGTNLARALERAFALYPEGGEKRLVLLTDGNETSTASKRNIALAKQMGIKIFPVIPPSGQHPEVSLEKFIAPPLVREGSAFSLRLVVRNGNDRTVRGSIEVLANEQSLTRQELTISPGLSVLEIPAQISQKGNYLLGAEINARPDTITGNNHQQATLAVTGKVRALVITDNPKTHLARALKLKEVEVEFRRPEGIPTQLSDLLDYNCLVFDDVGRGGITAQQMTVIENYVRDFGGGFLMAGGMRAFGDLNYQNTTIERVLPITFREQRPKKKKRTPIALFVVIDRSNSMGYNSKVRGLHDGQKMHYAQKAAVELLGQLQDTDYAGGIAFDSEPYMLSPLARLSENRADLTSKISRLQYGGGTDFYGALETAADQLGQMRGAIRHILLLTDGDSNRAAATTTHSSLLSPNGRSQSPPFVSVTIPSISSSCLSCRRKQVDGSTMSPMSRCCHSYSLKTPAKRCEKKTIPTMDRRRSFHVLVSVAKSCKD